MGNVDPASWLCLCQGVTEDLALSCILLGRPEENHLHSTIIS